MPILRDKLWHSKNKKSKLGIFIHLNLFEGEIRNYELNEGEIRKYGFNGVKSQSRLPYSSMRNLNSSNNKNWNWNGAWLPVKFCQPNKEKPIERENISSLGCLLYPHLNGLK